MGKWFNLFLFILFSTAAIGQESLVKRALRHIDQNDFDKARASLAKLGEKDSLYSGLSYGYAQLFFDPEFGQFDIDTAHYWIDLARQQLDSLDSKDISKLAKIEAGPVEQERLDNAIDSAAFRRAKTDDDERAYVYFLTYYPNTAFEAEAISLRDQNAFEKVVEENTYQAYRTFMGKYPEALQYNEAQKRYERLYFQKSTASGKVSDYQKFLKANPNTPYRNEAETLIFQVLTASHNAEGYAEFIRQYPDSPLARKARLFQYHVIKDGGEDLSGELLNDSLSRVFKTPDHLIPFMVDKKFGLMDLKGNVVSESQFPQMNPSYLCAGVKGDVFISQETLYAVHGPKIISGVKSYESLGLGLLKVVQGKGVRIIHKSGYLIYADYVQDAKLIRQKFLAIQVNDKWGLYTVSGIELATPRFDDIFSRGSYVLFEQDGKFDIKTDRQLIDAADNNPIQFKSGFDDYELLASGAIWLQSNDNEVIFDQELKELIPMRHQKINFLPYGYIVSQPEAEYLLNDSFDKVNSRLYKDLEYNQNYILATDDTVTRIIRADNYVDLGEFEEAELLGSQFAVGYRGDTTLIFATRASENQFAERIFPKLISAAGSSEFVRVDVKGEVNIIDQFGVNIRMRTYDEYSALGDLLLVSKRGKRGAYFQGSRVLAPIYDALGTQDEGFTLFKDGKFGFYSPKTNTLIEPRYNKRLLRYGKDILSGERRGALTFFSSSGKELSRVTNIKEVQYWTDSIALVKNAESWQFFNIHENKYLDAQLRSFTRFENGHNEIILIALGDEGYGVLSNQHGEVIPLSFNDVVQIGPVENPIYFTEKHISEAEFYVVIYYDKDGQVIRKQAFEALDYDLIYCDK